MALDVRAALRALRSRPSYFLVATLTLALAIAATTSVFSVVDALMLRPLPYANPESVVQLQAHLTTPHEDSIGSRFTLDQWHRLQQRTDLFAGVEPHAFGTHVLARGAEPTIVAVAQVTPGMMQMLGVPPQLGRLLTPEDATANQGRALVISDRFWREEFGRDNGIIGRSVLLDDAPYEIVGVMPASFSFPRTSVRAWRPYLAPAAMSGRAPRVELIARVRRGLTLDQAQRDLRAQAPALQHAGVFPPNVVPETTAIRTVNIRERLPLTVLLGAVFLVLAVACANVMNLGLAVGSGRRREFAVCTALGASRARLFRQVLIEALMLSVVAGAAGAWLAYAMVEALAPLMPTDLVFLSAHAIRVDSRVLMFTTGFTVLSAMIAGLLPALRGSRAEVADALKAGGRSQSPSSSHRRLLSVSAVAQCTLAIVLLSGAGLLIRSFVKLQAVDPGFDTEHLLLMGISLRQPGGSTYATAAAQRAFFDRLVADVETLPGVRRAIAAGGAPPLGGGFRSADLETDAAPGETVALEVPFTAVTPDYFSVMGIRMLAGAVFDANAPATTVVIDEVFAKRFWGSAQAAVGRRFRMGSDEDWHTVVGVTADVKMMGLDDRIGEGLEYYYPMPRTGAGWAGTSTLIVRTAVDPSSLIPAVKQRVWALNPKLPIHDAAEMRERIATSLSRRRFFLILMTLFAGIAAIIAAVGIYSVFSYSVAERMPEMGIRLALGATANQIARMVLSEGAKLACIGAALGLIGAWMTSRVLTTLLFKTTPTDPVALASGAGCLIALGLLACYVPARRARRTDPLVMLKVE